MLKLIVNNSAPFSKGLAPKRSIGEVSDSGIPLKKSPLFDCREIGEYLYSFRGFDVVHNLALETTFEIKEMLSEESCIFKTAISCQCPSIDIHRLNETISGDEYLQEMLVVLFQLQFLEEVLLFCENKGASHLLMNFNDDNLGYLEIYGLFSTSEEKLLTNSWGSIEITIPADTQTYDAIVDSIDEVNQEFLQTLWSNQKTNIAFRNYLKRNSLTIN